MVDGDTVQALDECCAVRVLGAVEDTVEDGLVFTVDVVILQEPAQFGTRRLHQSVRCIKRMGHISSQC